MKEKKPHNIKIGQRIRSAREAKGWTREQLAEKIDLSVQFITDLELGNSGIRLDRFAILCQLLDADAHTILFGDVIQRPMLFHLETMLTNRNSEDVQRIIKMIEAMVEAYFYS